MEKLFRFNVALWLLAALAAGAGAAEKGGAAPRPSITVQLNNNPKIAAVWRNPINGGEVDVSNAPGIMVTGNNFKNGPARIAAYFGDQLAAEGQIKVNSGYFQALLPLKSPLADPGEVTIRIGEEFSQSVPVRLRRVRGTVRLADGSPVRSPLVTSGLYRRSAFFVTAVGDKRGNFEILLPDRIAFISVFEKNSSKEKLECRDYGGELKDGPRLDVCMEPRLRFFPEKSKR